MFLVMLSVSVKKSALILEKKVCNFSVSPLKMKWTCPIFSVSITVAVNPPRVDQNLAALEAAATTELSSIAIGMVLYFPLIRKLGATPKGM